MRVYLADQITMRDYQTDNAALVLPHKLQVWANQMQSSVNMLAEENDKRRMESSDLNSRVLDLEELIPAMNDLLEFLKGAHPEVLKAYHDTRAATNKMTR
jgi:hypothetical protein